MIKWLRSAFSQCFSPFNIQTVHSKTKAHIAEMKVSNIDLEENKFILNNALITY